ncbi:MAG: TIGR02996 domain-containing protein, partial [Gemmataceae bacterium]|nr:TIGR02996 domain-containing protein [Gemmataceae bacterium]
MRTFVFQDDKSHKFWNIALEGDRYTVTFGKVGGKGQSKGKAFAGAAEAKAAHDKIIAEKLADGYVETTPPAPPTPVSTKPTPALQPALEAALVANPDELTAYSAYADYLTEEGDPRGEFVSVQLALEE